jgi:hypothetical protein
MGKHRILRPVMALLVLIILAGLIVVVGLASPGVLGSNSRAATPDGLVFIHHSVGQNWLDDGLHVALQAKEYVGQRNDIYYGVDLAPDAARPDSLETPVGNYTDMNHWIFWFNDYLGSVKSHETPHGLKKLISRVTSRLGLARSQGSGSAFNRIVMFKSCFPNSDIRGDGSELGDPFESESSLANYQAIYRHPDGPGHTYTHDGVTYKPLEEIFAANPGVLFIAITAPPLHYAPSDATNDANAHRTRVFNNWLQDEWLASYQTAHPGINNVAVFDLFDLLAYPDDHAAHPNRLRAEFGGESGDSHPNQAANAYLTQVFAANADDFLDSAWRAFIDAGAPQPQTSPASD